MFSDCVLKVKHPYMSSERGELPVLPVEVFLFTCSALWLVWGDAVFTLDHPSKHGQTAAIPVVLLMCSRVLCPPLFSGVYFCLFFPFFHCTLPLWYFTWFSTSINLFFFPSLCYPICPQGPPSSPAVSSSALTRSSYSLGFQFSLLHTNVSPADSLQFLVPFY